MNLTKPLKNGNAAGVDGIPSEELKYGGEEIIEYLYKLLKKVSFLSQLA